MASVLIIAGEHTTRAGCARIVGAAGHAVCGSASSAMAALSAARKRAPQMALVDLSLGANAEGLWVARELADQFGTRLLLLTGAADERIVGAASLLGAAAVLRKPVEPGAMTHALHRAATGQT